ncbi:purine nucleoside permease [Paraburkholderia rhizosphaerae]|uniref:Purine nucleoside permease n=2 Tax=Paraburkholderia rhizosphaerae TaxID=480658 RepID=A0A4V6QD68_9BURK|nr:purine nucleoside permease [Paraburkholderia rhizosphaerae]
MKIRRSRRSTAARASRTLTALGCAAATAVACMSALPGIADAQTHTTPHAGTSPHAVPKIRAPKVMIVSMFGPEGQVWLDKLGPWQQIRVPGLSPDYPMVRCNEQDVCVMTTGMGHANAAASMMALTFSPQFDLRHTYFLIAGIAGIDPARGTLGSAAWANYLVDFGIQWEIDGREAPPKWTSGYSGIFAKSQGDKPPLEYQTEVFELNHQLTDTALALSRDVELADAPQAQATRAKYDYAPANQPPKIIQCDTSTSDTWWSGDAIGERAREWTKIVTDGKGLYCTSQQEDNATYEALKRAASVQRIDLKRVAVLRTGADFDRPPKGQSSVDNLLNTNGQGGGDIALANLYRAGSPLVQSIVTQWAKWKEGVPTH